MKKYLVLLISITTLLSFSQHEIKIKVELDTILNILEIDQQILLGELKNKKDSIYLLDWNNSFNSKNTHLAKSFSEEYKKKFHLAKDKERGFTKIESIKDAYDNDLIYYRLKTNQDVIVVKLDSMNPIIRIKYRLKIPSNKFTGYGYTKSKNYYLQYWHLVPAMKLDAWTFYSNRNLNDIPSSKYNITALEIKTPDNYHVTTELKETKSELSTSNGFKYSFWESKEIYDPKIYIEKERPQSSLGKN